MALLDDIVKNNRFKPKAMRKFWPAQADGDDVIIYDNDMKTELARFCFLRQQTKKKDSMPHLSLADYIAPVDSNRFDYLGGFVVTVGEEVEKFAKTFEEKHDDYSSIMVKAIGDRIAEAMAERLHHKTRIAMGIEKDEEKSFDDLIKENYRGLRPAPGYPACPDHSQKQKLWKLMDVENQIGVKLTESCAMTPASSVSGFYFNHPEAKYFRVGQIDEDQIIDYAKRKDMELEKCKSWLESILSR